MIMSNRGWLGSAPLLMIMGTGPQPEHGWSGETK